MAVDHNLFGIINGQYFIVVKITIKYQSQIFKVNITQGMCGYHNYNWPSYYLNGVSNFSALNLVEIKHWRQYSGKKEMIKQIENQNNM